MRRGLIRLRSISACCRPLGREWFLARPKRCQAGSHHVAKIGWSSVASRHHSRGLHEIGARHQGSRVADAATGRRDQHLAPQLFLDPANAACPVQGRNLGTPLWGIGSAAEPAEKRITKVEGELGGHPCIDDGLVRDVSDATWLAAADVRFTSTLAVRPCFASTSSQKCRCVRSAQGTGGRRRLGERVISDRLPTFPVVAKRDSCAIRTLASGSASFALQTMGPRRLSVVARWG
jgi:hypothetical protein